MLDWDVIEKAVPVIFNHDVYAYYNIYIYIYIHIYIYIYIITFNNFVPNVNL